LTVTGVALTDLRTKADPQISDIAIYEQLTSYEKLTHAAVLGRATFSLHR